MSLKKLKDEQQFALVIRIKANLKANTSASNNPTIHNKTTCAHSDRKKNRSKLRQKCIP